MMYPIGPGVRHWIQGSFGPDPDANGIPQKTIVLLEGSEHFKITE
jgi:hypothetical protein